MPNHKPCRRQRNRPQSKIEINTTVLSEDSQRLEAVAKRLPGTFGSTQQRGVANHLGLVVAGEVLDDKVEVEVVELESERQEDKDAETAAEAGVIPVEGGLCACVLCHDDGGPEPEGSRESEDYGETVAGADFEGDLGAVDPVL